MREHEQGQIVAAIMLAAGVNEVTVTDEVMAGHHDAVVMFYRDNLRDQTVFRLVTRPDVIDGEEVAAVTYEIEAPR